MKKHTLPIFTAISLAILSILLLIACGDTATTGTLPTVPVYDLYDSAESTADASIASTPTPEPTPTPVPTPTPFPERDITLLAVGDNLMHTGIIKTGLQEDGTYDYSFLFEGIADFLDIADIKVINQETILGGNELGFTGYPRFNSPTEVGDAIAAAGFNVVLHASNHAADKEIEGLLSCVDFWDKYPEVLVAGINGKVPGTMDADSIPNEGDADSTPTEGDGEADSTPANEHAVLETRNDIPLLTIDGITFAVLNYTYGPNLGTLPSDIKGHLNMLCDYDEKSGRIDFMSLHPQVITDIEKAEALADVVIVFPHWGTEYTTKPSSYQENWALQMTEAGADLIIGTHPHVIQPVEWITAENGNKALCYYSLGNYVSTQKKELCMLEALAWVTFHVAEDGITISEEKTGALPLVCHYNGGPVRMEGVYLLEDYTEEQAAAHGIKPYGGVTLKLEDLYRWRDEVLGDRVLTAEQILNQ